MGYERVALHLHLHLLRAETDTSHHIKQRLMLSASNIPTPNHSSDYSEPTTLLLLPAFVIIENVTPAAVPTLISDYVDRAPTNTSALQPVSTAIPDSLPPPDLPEPAAKLHGLRSRPSPHSVLILLCSQKTRDARCGQSAPLISKEMQRVTRTPPWSRPPMPASY